MSLPRIVQLVVVVFVSAFVAAIDPITVNGRHFVNSETGKKVNSSSLKCVSQFNVACSFGSRE